MEASCQCGAITFTCPLPAPLHVYICHCTQCRRQSGSAFGISAIFPSFDIKPHHSGSGNSSANAGSDEQNLRTWTRPTLSGKTMTCYFCGVCGSRLVHARDGVETVSVKGGCLEGLTREMVAGAVHIWTKEAVVQIPEGVESWEEEPDD